MNAFKNPSPVFAHGKPQETPTREAPTTDEERLDEALDESFPASDPPATGANSSH